MELDVCGRGGALSQQAEHFTFLKRCVTCHFWSTWQAKYYVDMSVRRVALCYSIANGYQLMCTNCEDAQGFTCSYLVISTMMVQSKDCFLLKCTELYVFEVWQQCYNRQNPQLRNIS